jgi:acetoin utilization protein AcuB
MLKLSDIMTTEVATASPELSLREAMDLLSSRHITGAPVVAGGKVVGVFSASDLLAFLSDFDGSESSLEFRRKRHNPLEEVPVAEVMTRYVQSLPPDCPVDKAAAFMHEANIHRVLVMKDDVLMGIVSTTDVAIAVADHRLGRVSAAK